MQLGTLVGFPEAAPLIQPGLGFELGLSKRVAVGVRGGLHSGGEGWKLRDGLVEAVWVPVVQDAITLRLTGGLSLPVGSVAAGSYFTPLSTGSIDPILGAELVGGATWVGVVSGWSRIPLFDGLDRRLQGPYVRGDLRGGRRIGASVVSLGGSAAWQTPSVPVDAAPDFAELAATGGLVVAPWDRWSVGGQLRVPVWTSEPAYRLAAGVVVRTVLGGGGKAKEDDHH